MRYKINELISNSLGYIFYKGPNYKEDTDYYISGVESFLKDKENALFIPIRIVVNGATEDYYSNIKKETELGARGFFFDEAHFADPKYRKMLMDILEDEKYKNKIDVVIMVKNTLRACFALAQYTKDCKMSKKTRYIGVTGTIGKTSSTEMVWAVISNKHKAYRGEPELNIRYRVNHKFFEVEPDVDFMLFELSGMNPGYMKMFSELLQPDGCILTKISNENLEVYGTMERIADEKSTLLAAMHKDSIAIINNTDILKKATKDYECKKIYVDENQWELIKSDKDGSVFKYKGNEYFIPVVGLHQIDNAIRVIELCLHLGFSVQEIQEGLPRFRPIGNRWLVDKYPDNMEFISDCPNNPSYDTLISAVNTFTDLYKDFGYKRFVLTKIISLGDSQEATFKKIAEFLSKSELDELVCVDYQLLPIANYVKEHSDIKVVTFERPQAIDKNASYIKYLLENMKANQATLLKGLWLDGNLNYGNTKFPIREHFKCLNN